MQKKPPVRPAWRVQYNGDGTEPHVQVIFPDLEEQIRQLKEVAGCR